MRHVFAVAAFAPLLASVACSSSTSPAATGSCSGTLTFTAVTTASGSSAECPTITAQQLNAPSDAGSSGCTTTFTQSGSTCSAAISCNGDGVATTGTATSTAGVAQGSFSVTVPGTDGGAPVSCTYNFTGTVK